MATRMSWNDPAKEMDRWVNEGRTMTVNDTLRHSGQLSDNVTEQRMLMSKLKDLAKERMKFTKQNDFEKRFFLTQQSRKSPELRQFLSSLSNDGQLKNGYKAESRRKHWTQNGSRKTPGTPSPDRRETYLADSKSSFEQNEKVVTMPPIQAGRPHSAMTVMFQTDPENVEGTAGPRPKMENTFIYGVPELKNINGARSVRFSSDGFKNHVQDRTSKLPSSKTRSARDRKDSHHIPQSVKDPRYQELMGTLTSNYCNQKNQDILQIMAKIKSLQSPMGKQTRAGLHMKLRDFLARYGVDFDM